MFLLWSLPRTRSQCLRVIIMSATTSVYKPHEVKTHFPTSNFHNLGMIFQSAHTWLFCCLLHEVYYSMCRLKLKGKHHCIYDHISVIITHCRSGGPDTGDKTYRFRAHTEGVVAQHRETDPWRRIRTLSIHMLHAHCKRHDAALRYHDALVKNLY